MERLFIEPRHQPLFAAVGWNSFASISGHFLELERKGHGAVIVRRGKIEHGGHSLEVFFKQYEFRNASWAFLWRASKALREFENYELFAQFGVPAAERVVCGEQRDALGRLKRAFIITRAIANSETLVDFLRRGPSRQQREEASRKLAEMTARLHRANFFCHDLVWRNVLVTLHASGTPQLWLIDCPRGAFARFGRERKRLRDLASLDKSAVKFCSRAERLRFFLRYVGQRHLDHEAKKLARACLEYRRTRWPDDWTGK